MARIVGVVQARMGSTRLPGKVMADICGEPMIWHIVQRLLCDAGVYDVVLAIPDTLENEPLLEWAHEMDVSYYAGSEHDLISRIYHAAMLFRADAIVRITGDCPLVDPYMVDRMVGHYEAEGVDYLSNVCPRSYPDGLDVEIYSLPLLHRLWRTIASEFFRENFPYYLWGDRKLAEGWRNEEYEEDLSSMRWTVDYPEDLEFVRAVYAELGDIFPWRDVLKLLERKPELAEINASVKDGRCNE